jgi:hypothetical protein
MIPTAVIILALLLISDIGILLRFWSGPVGLLHNDFRIFDAVILSEAVLPAAAAAGLIEAGDGRLRRQRASRLL